MHLDIGQAFRAFISAIFFAWLYIKTKSLLPSIFAHFVTNGFSRILTYVLNIKINGYNSNTDIVVHQPLWFDFLGISLTILGFVILIKAFNKNNSNERTSMREHY